MDAFLTDSAAVRFASTKEKGSGSLETHLNPNLVSGQHCSRYLSRVNSSNTPVPFPCPPIHFPSSSGTLFYDMVLGADDSGMSSLFLRLPTGRRGKGQC